MRCPSLHCAPVCTSTGTGQPPFPSAPSLGLSSNLAPVLDLGLPASLTQSPLPHVGVISAGMEGVLHRDGPVSHAEGVDEPS